MKRIFSSLTGVPLGCFFAIFILLSLYTNGVIDRLALAWTAASDNTLFTFHVEGFTEEVVNVFSAVLLSLIPCHLSVLLRGSNRVVVEFIPASKTCRRIWVGAISIG